MAARIKTIEKVINKAIERDGSMLSRAKEYFNGGHSLYDGYVSSAAKAIHDLKLDKKDVEKFLRDNPYNKDVYEDRLDYLHDISKLFNGVRVDHDTLPPGEYWGSTSGFKLSDKLAYTLNDRYYGMYPDVAEQAKKYRESLSKQATSTKTGQKEQGNIQDAEVVTLPEGSTPKDSITEQVDTAVEGTGKEQGNIQDAEVVTPSEGSTPKDNKPDIEANNGEKESKAEGDTGEAEEEKSVFGENLFTDKDYDTIREKAKQAGGEYKHHAETAISNREAYFNEKDDLNKQLANEKITQKEFDNQVSELRKSYGFNDNETADEWFNRKLRDEPGMVDWIMGNKIPQTAGGLAIGAYGLSAVFGDGRKSNAELYGDPF